MPKKRNLANALNKAAGKIPEPVAPEETVKKVTSTSEIPPSRRGKKAITGHFDPIVSKQLRQIALDQDSTVQALLAEALNDLFIKYGHSAIAE